MAGRLETLLGANSTVLGHEIDMLERATGRHGVDVALIGESIALAKQATDALGFDVKDATGEELYRATLAKVEKDNRRLTMRLGGANPDDVTDMAERIVRFLRREKVGRQAWVLKRPVAKRLLKQNPPHALMKQLGYRSVDSMLKRESIDELFVALRFSEGDNWLADFSQSYRFLRPSDFETRDITLLVLDKNRYGALSQKHSELLGRYTTHSKEMGVVALMPAPFSHMKGFTLQMLLLFLHYINEVRVYSSYVKLKQVDAHFGSLLASTLQQDLLGAAEVVGVPIHWRAVHRYFGTKGSIASHPELFEPHIVFEDIEWLAAEKQLARLDEHMRFWEGLDYVATLVPGAEVVSFNLMDCSYSYSRELSFQNRSLYYFREALWNHLVGKYIDTGRLEKQLLSSLS